MRHFANREAARAHIEHDPGGSGFSSHEQRLIMGSHVGARTRGLYDIVTYPGHDTSELVEFEYDLSRPGKYSNDRRKALRREMDRPTEIEALPQTERRSPSLFTP